MNEIDSNKDKFKWNDHTQNILNQGMQYDTALKTEELLKDLIPDICGKICLAPIQIFDLLESFFCENAPKFQILVKLMTKITSIE